MALIPAKTYSKKNHEFSALSDRDKENIDPFDELLSSPLKQDVQFQPLSFWGEKGRNNEQKKKSRTVKCGLFETSDSDEHSSPLQRKRKLKSKNSFSKRTLQPKSSSKKLSVRKKNHSVASLLTERTKSHKSIISNATKGIPEGTKLNKNELNKIICQNESMEEMLKFSNKGCDNFKCNNANDFNLDSTSENLYLVQYQGDRSKKSRECNYNINQKNSNFKVYEDFDTLPTTDGKTTDVLNSIINNTSFNESAEETLKNNNKDRQSLNFINVKRHYNFFSLPDKNFNYSLNSFVTDDSQEFSNQLWNDSKSDISPRVKTNHYDSWTVNIDTLNSVDECSYKEDDDDDDNDYFINNTLLQHSNENMDQMFCTLNSDTLISENSEALSVQEDQSENTLSDSFGVTWSKITKLKDIQELLWQHNANEQDRVTADLSLSSDETFSEPNDGDTIIRVPVEVEKNPNSSGAFEEKEIYSACPSSAVLQLTDKISDLSLSKATDDELLRPEAENPIVSQGLNLADKENSFLIDLQNVTTKRRGFRSNRYGEDVSRVSDSRVQSTVASGRIQQENDAETEFVFDQTLKLPRITDRMSLDWNKTVSFANPIFESTRVIEMSPTEKIPSQGPNLFETILEETRYDHTYTLKPGKKWLRSISVLKQLQNGNISKIGLESTKITGRKFESFVQDMMEMQNANSRRLSIKTCEVNAPNSFPGGFNGYRTALNVGEVSNVEEFFSFNDSVLTKSMTEKTISEKVLLNRTVKVIQPGESSSAFRSALGLESSHLTIQEEPEKEESSCLSARDFILIQCGQEDVLPFEEYFNEKTLINCKKIGEGVYGEVFMCSDTVIKIIPIEGSDKVNGEPQKTFEEIISEVVIASKLSNLRKCEKNRTDGFSEMKRCWCVQGKYPKYLLQLWNEYDQLGSGSENDSPVMFKDDQLYIILELANGGKDLEAFVFSSAAQSLSLFIQTAFSLAVAEKAFEFEHRDLHWGNILISETKDKVMNFTLNGTEYKIPTKGVKVCIIDFTLSRMNHEGCCIFNDLSVDPGLFASEGDYQFEIYRMMLREVNNDWSLFRPKNNLFWLHYVLDKMIKMVRYKSKKGKIHSKHIKNLKTLESSVLKYNDSTHFVLSSSLSNVINSL